MTSIFDQNLPRTAANFAPLSPLGFIERTAEVYPERLAIVHGSLRQTWAQTYARCRQLASALRRSGIGKNDTVAVMLPNTPPMVEAHFGVPMAGAVLNAINTRLDPETVAFMLDHAEAKAVIVDPEFAPVMAKALALRKNPAPLLVIDVEDALYGPASQLLGSATYEAFLATGDQGRGLPPPGRSSQRHQQRAGMGHAQARRVPVDAAHVPLQRLVLPVDGGGAGWRERVSAPRGCAVYF